jgi:hypothetical protein
MKTTLYLYFYDFLIFFATDSSTLSTLSPYQTVNSGCFPVITSGKTVLLLLQICWMFLAQ